MLQVEWLVERPDGLRQLLAAGHREKPESAHAGGQKLVHAMCMDGRLRSLKFGARRLIPRADLLALAAGETERLAG